MKKMGEILLKASSLIKSHYILKRKRVSNKSEKYLIWSDARKNQYVPCQIELWSVFLSSNASCKSKSQTWLQKLEIKSENQMLVSTISPKTKCWSQRRNVILIAIERTFQFNYEYLMNSLNYIILTT